MSGPPPPNLRDWSKKELAREVERLRAITREMARPGVEGDPREGSGEGLVIDAAGDPHAAGGALLDARNAVLMDAMEVVLADAKHETDPILMFMVLKGRVNYSDSRVEHGYMFGPDGAAALVSELVGLASRASAHPGHGQRFAAEFQVQIERRMKEMP
jgi:hypothetical protein